MSEQANAAAAQPAQQQQPTQSWTLFVGQIPNDVNEDTLKQLFSTYGLVTESKILVDKQSNKPKGCGFITYADKHGAETAIATLHEKYTLPGAPRPLIVRYSTKQLAAEKADPGPFKLYISNLSKQTSEDEIRAMFSQYGQLVDDVVILKDNMSGVSKGVAFVRYNTRAEAMNAINALNEQIRDKDSTNLMQVKFAHTPLEKKQMLQKNMGMNNAHPIAATQMGGYYPAHFNPAYQQGGYPYMPHMTGYQSYGGMHGVNAPPPHHSHSHAPHHPRQPIAKGPDGANLFVYGIPESFTDGELQAMFANFGNVINAKVYRDLSTGKSKGFGFVSYDSVASASQACQAMDGYLIAGKKMTVKPKTDGPQHNHLMQMHNQSHQPHQQTSMAMMMQQQNTRQQQHYQQQHISNQPIQHVQGQTGQNAVQQQRGYQAY